MPQSHMSETASESPVIFVAPKLGSLSEVWLYRQATKMPQVKTVVCSEHLNPYVFPAHGIEVQHYPVPAKSTRSKLVGHLYFRLNQFKRQVFSHEFYSASKDEDRWWSDLYQQNQDCTFLFHYGVTAAKFAPLAVRNNVRFGIHFNGYDLSMMMRDKLYVTRLRQVAKDASLLVVVADYMKQELLSLGVDHSKIRYIPYGVPLADFECPRSSSYSDPVTFLMVGRLTPKKHPVATIRAFGLCAKKCPNVQLRVIGSGDLADECKRIASELDLDNKIIFHGAMPSEDVRKAMCESDVFVQHSVTSEKGDKEGWPVAIAEAAASGLPIVSTRHASIPEQVIDGETGFLVFEGNWQEMGSKMTTLASQHDLRHQFGLASRNHISQWDTSTQIAKLGIALQQI
ncbi:glycosyltransferase family 4 protein [Mariniblastus sp.]|nr:glycosyltransferase family 4 protein [Mariniblastus sp.]